MPKAADLYVEVGAKTDKLKRGLKQGSNEVNKFGQTVKRVGGIIAAAFSIRVITNFLLSLKLLLHDLSL